MLLHFILLSSDKCMTKPTTLSTFPQTVEKNNGKSKTTYLNWSHLPEHSVGDSAIVQAFHS